MFWTSFLLILYKDTNMKIYQIKIETGYVTVWADSFMDACKEVREAGFTVLGGHQVA